MIADRFGSVNFSIHFGCRALVMIMAVCVHWRMVMIRWAAPFCHQKAWEFGFLKLQLPHPLPLPTLRSLQRSTESRRQQSQDRRSPSNKTATARRGGEMTSMLFPRSALRRLGWGDLDIFIRFTDNLYILKSQVPSRLSKQANKQSSCSVLLTHWHFFPFSGPFSSALFVASLFLTIRSHNFVSFRIICTAPWRTTFCEFCDHQTLSEEGSSKWTHSSRKLVNPGYMFLLKAIFKWIYLFFPWNKSILNGSYSSYEYTHGIVNRQ